MTHAARRLPSLDGLRGLAILLVMGSHVGGAEWISRLGSFGVELFFVLSGFLITTLLLKEYVESGRIDVPRFFVRRAFRIFPAAYVFMLVVLTLAAWGLIQLRPGDSLFALTYTMNLDPAPSWWLGHTWSLSIEEQFYLVWPFGLLLARPRRGAVLAIAALVATPLARTLLMKAVPGFDEGIERSLITAVDGFAAGSLLALTRDRLERSTTYLRVIGAPWFTLMLPAAALLNNLEHHPVAFYGAIQTLVYLGLALVLHRTQLTTDDALGRVLNWRPLAWLGTLSYSLYLWQQLFLVPHSGHAPLRALLHVPLALACAWVSWRAVERPFIRLRDRHWPARSTAAPLGIPAAGAVSA